MATNDLHFAADYTEYLEACRQREQHEGIEVVTIHANASRPMKAHGTCDVPERMKAQGAYVAPDRVGSCDARSIAERQVSALLSGSCESRKLAGSCDARAFTGACDARAFTGSCDARAFAGSCEARAFAGSCEARAFSGSCDVRAFSDSSAANKNSL